VPGHGALAGAAAGARDVDEQQLVLDRVRPPARGRDGRREQGDDGSADRGGEVRRAGVADHDGVRAGQHAGQAGEVGGAAEVEPRGAGHARGQRPLRVRAGHHGAPAGRGERRDQLGVALRRPRPRGDGGARVHHDVAPVDGRSGALDGEPAVVTRWQREARVGREAQRALHLVHVAWVGAAEIEQRAGIVDAHGPDPRHAGQPQRERGRQRALVEGAEDQRAVGGERGHLRDERVEVLARDRIGLGIDPRRAPDDQLVDSREQLGGAAPARAAQQRDAVGTRGERPQSRPGEQDIAVVVEAHGEHARHDRPPSRRRSIA
jgi:hypothetical protein